MRPPSQSTHLFAAVVGALLVALGVGCATPQLPSVLRVGTSGDYAPFSKRVDGQLSGFDIDVAERFGSDTDRLIAWVPFRWPDLMTSLAEGRFDVAMSGVTIRAERSVHGRFTLPVAETGAMLLVRESSVQQPQDPQGTTDAALSELDDPALRLAVNAGGHLERVARKRFGAAQIRAIPGNADVRAALVAGDVDAVVTDSLEAPFWLEGLEGVRAVGPFTRDRKAYWVATDAPELAAELDAWLLERERDGTLAAIRSRWFPAAAARSATATPIGALLAACDERLALMPAIAEFKRAAGAGIVDPERESRVVEAGWNAVASAAAASEALPPPKPAVETFYRAQIDAAVAVQRRVLEEPAPPKATPAASFDLETELRPALLRIGERMAWLLVKSAGSSAAPGSLEERVAQALARHRLPDSRIAAIADSLERIASSHRGL